MHLKLLVERYISLTFTVLAVTKHLHVSIDDVHVDNYNIYSNKIIRHYLYYIQGLSSKENNKSNIRDRNVCNIQNQSDSTISKHSLLVCVNKTESISLPLLRFIYVCYVCILEIR